jgi:hypothetical protein
MVNSEYLKTNRMRLLKYSFKNKKFILRKIKLSTLGLLAFLLSATIFIACSKDNNEEIQLTTADKLNIFFKSSEYKNTMTEMEEITNNIDYHKFSLKSAINENNTFNDDYIANNLSATKYKSIKDFKSDFNKLFIHLQFLKDKHPVLNPKNSKEIVLYFEKDNLETKKMSKETDCAATFRGCTSRAKKAFLYSMAAVPTCGAWAGYCFGLSVLQYNDARGECKDEVFDCLGIKEK